MNAFESRPLPQGLAVVMRERLSAAHREEPFSALDPRASARRVLHVTAALGVTATLYRGGLDLRGSEVDHLWIEVDGRVVDLAFPLFAQGFVDVLRDYVAGHVGAEALQQAAVGAALDDRVMGVFPRPLAYRGMPVWSTPRR